MREDGGLGTAEPAREPDLTPGRRQQIEPADHQRDVLFEIVDRHGELVAPVAAPVADQRIAALLPRHLRLAAQQSVGEGFRTGGHPKPPADAVAEREAAVPAMTRVAEFAGGRPRELGSRRRGDVSARAVAAEQQASLRQLGGRRAIGGVAVGLASRARPLAILRGREDVRLEAEPVEILEQRLLVARLATLAIVVLDAQQHARLERLREAPHVDGVGDVPEVQEAGGGRREARPWRRRQPLAQRGQIRSPPPGRIRRRLGRRAQIARIPVACSPRISMCTSWVPS
ncbi:hypothetical protein KJ059_09605 [Myxococcota bacterium]|nr:hypothetical protein [Myxococcota bacterium]